MTLQTKHWKWSYSRFIAAPVELRTYLIFSTVVTLFGFFVQHVQPTGLKEKIVPITGWTGLLMYGQTLFFIFALLFFKDYKQVYRIRLLFAVIGSLLMHILFGIFYLLPLLESDYNDYGNPYLIISRWQPLWTIVLPLFWITLLISSRVKRFCQLSYE